jgi:hypothetical protein
LVAGFVRNRTLAGTRSALKNGERAERFGGLGEPRAPVSGFHRFGKKIGGKNIWDQPTGEPLKFSYHCFLLAGNGEFSPSQF